MNAYVGANPLTRLTRAQENATTTAEAFGEFVHRNTQFAYRVAYARVRNRADAEDAVQEAFLKLHRAGGWQSALNERAYLARTVWRSAADLAGRSARHPAGEQSAPEPVDAAPDAEQQLLHTSAEAQVHQLIDALPEKLRRPLALVSLQEMSSAEVAAVLKIPEGTVRRRVMQARALLKQKMRAMEVDRA